MSSTSQFLCHATLSCSFTPFSVNWLPCSAKLSAVGSTANGKGMIQLLELIDSKLTVINQSNFDESIKCSTFGASSYENRQLAIGDVAGNLSVIDVEYLQKPSLVIKSAHQSIINSIDGCGGLNIGGGAPELVTGSRDGCVKVWDLRVSDPVCVLEPEAGARGRDCWAVAFGNSYNDSERCVAAGYDNGDVKLLDLRTTRLRWETNVSNGVVGLQFDRKDIEMNKLIVTSLESQYRVFDLRTQHPTEGFASLNQSAHKSTIWLARHTPHSRDMWLTAGGNGTMSLWQYSYPAQRAVKDEEGHMKGVMGEIKLKGEGRWGEQPVVSAEWHPEKPGLLATASLDQQIRLGMVTKVT